MSRAEQIRNRYLDVSTESLERRQMLAGNVTAFVDGLDRIIVRGDAADNLAVVESDASGLIWLRGVDGTRINGEDQPELIGANGELTRNLRIDLRGGDDQFAFNDLQLIGEVDLRTGGGDDLVLVNEVFAFEQQRIDLGAGADRFGAANVVMQHELTVLGRSGGDYAQLTDFVAIRDVNIQLHGGDDEFRADDTTIAGQLEIRDAGAGDDLVELTRTDVRESLRVSLVSGDDTVRIRDDHSDRSFDEWVIQTGAGHDVVELEESDILEGALQIVTGGGDDRLIMTNVSGDTVYVDLQGGADQADLYDIQVNHNNYSADGLTFLLGSGNDVLLGRYIYADGFTEEGAPVEVIIDGGTGADRMLFDYLGGYMSDNMGPENPMQVITGAGNDLLAIINDGYLDQLEIDLGGGSDQLLIFRVDGENWAISGGAGNDVILVDESEYMELARLSISAGSGRDTVAVAGFGDFDNFQVGLFDVDMGSQNDVMYVSANHALGGRLHGGAGFDMYRQDPTVVAFLPPDNFEDVDDQPLASTWLGLRNEFLTAWIDAGGEAGDLDA